MAVVRALDANGDFTFGNSKGNYMTGISALKQNIVTRLKEHTGNCFFDKDSGINYDYFLTTKNKENELLNSIKLRILQTEDVREVIDVSLANVGNRSVIIRCTINSIYGIFDININV